MVLNTLPILNSLPGTSGTAPPLSGAGMNHAALPAGFPIAGIVPLKASVTVRSKATVSLTQLGTFCLSRSSSSRRTTQA